MAGSCWRPAWSRGAGGACSYRPVTVSGQCSSCEGGTVRRADSWRREVTSGQYPRFCLFLCLVNLSFRVEDQSSGDCPWSLHHRPAFPTSSTGLTSRPQGRAQLTASSASWRPSFPLTPAMSPLLKAQPHVTRGSFLSGPTQCGVVAMTAASVVCRTAVALLCC